MSTAETHYVLIIHGTFADQPVDGEGSWYHPSENRDNFCSRLAKELKQPKLGGAVWRSYEPPYWNWWPGENDHLERKAAGSRLCVSGAGAGGC